jgi:hypothetical protein
MSHTLLTDVPVAGSGRDPAFVDVYANQVRLSANLGDMTLVFGVIEDLGPGRMANRDRAAIRLSMVTAKALFLNLQASISGYEAAVGKIPLPAGLLGALAQMGPQVEAILKQQLDSASVGE